jgi:PhnB protein
MAFLPLLQFDGQCAEAFRFYARVFQGELSLTRYFEVTEAARLPPSDRVVYAELAVGEALLLGMDFPLGLPAPDGRHGAINWRVADVETGQHLFDLLLDGGFPIVPFGPNAWSAGFGMLRDRFDTIWVIATPGTPNDPAVP